MTTRLDGDGPIVMVDDSDADLLVARRCYQRSRLERPLVEVTSGEAFLEYLGRIEAGQEVMPALVLLDINMPGMSGFEVLQRTRSRPRFHHVPIFLMLTNSDNPADVERAYAEGASGFQVKPMRVGDYVAFFDSLEASSTG